MLWSAARQRRFGSHTNQRAGCSKGKAFAWYVRERKRCWRTALQKSGDALFDRRTALREFSNSAHDGRSLRRARTKAVLRTALQRCSAPPRTRCETGSLWREAIESADEPLCKSQRAGGGELSAVLAAREESAVSRSPGAALLNSSMSRILGWGRSLSPSVAWTKRCDEPRRGRAAPV